MASMTISPIPRPAPVNSPNTVGTMISARIGESRFVMISVMKTMIIAKPRITSTNFSYEGGCDARYTLGRSPRRRAFVCTEHVLPVWHLLRISLMRG